jgi:hypothetical protein
MRAPLAELKVRVTNFIIQFGIGWVSFLIRHFSQLKLQAARDKAAASLGAIQQGLARRQQAAATRATLELMLDTANVAAKVGGEAHRGG